MVAEKKVKPWLRCFLKQNKERNKKLPSITKKSPWFYRMKVGGERREARQKSAWY